MSEPILLSLLVNIAASVLWDGVKYSTGGLLHQAPIGRAIDDTVSAFTGIEDLHSTLARWCATDALVRLMERVQAGERSLTDDAVISSFVEVSGFYAGEETETLARQIIARFFEKLEEAIYASEQGLSTHAKRQEFLHQETRETVRQVGQSITPCLANLAEQQARILQRLSVSPDDIENMPEVREKIFHAKVDEARELMQAGKSRSARAQLLRLRRELADKSPSADLLFRIATNLGVCALDLSDIEVAKKELQLALDLRPNHPKALANAASLALVEGKVEEALQLTTRALKDQLQDSPAMYLHLEAMYRLGRTREIDQLIEQEPWISEDPTCTSVLGDIHYRDGNYAEAEVLLRKNLQQDAQKPHTYLLLAQVLLGPIEQLQIVQPMLPWRHPPEVIARRQEAERLLTEGISLLEEYENRSRLHEALVNRGVIRGMLGDLTGALRDCDRVILEDERCDVALRNKGQFLLLLDRPSEAIACLEKIQPGAEGLAAALPLASAYMEIDAPTKVVSLLKPLWMPDPNDRRQI